MRSGVGPGYEQLERAFSAVMPDSLWVQLNRAAVHTRRSGACQVLERVFE